MKVDLNNSVPIYEQIINLIQTRIAAGTYQTGERIPSVKDLAKELRVNPNTVQKAYSQLVSLGVVETRRGLGKFVTKKGANSAVNKSELAITTLLQQAVRMGSAANIPQGRLLSLFTEALSTSYSFRRSG